jgi:hypothetical protein
MSLVPVSGESGLLLVGRSSLLRWVLRLEVFVAKVLYWFVVVSTMPHHWPGCHHYAAAFEVGAERYCCSW